VTIGLFTSLKLLVRLLVHFCGSQRVQGLVDRRRVSVNEVDAEGRTRKLQLIWCLAPGRECDLRLILLLRVLHLALRTGSFALQRHQGGRSHGHPVALSRGQGRQCRRVGVFARAGERESRQVAAVGQPEQSPCRLSCVLHFKGKLEVPHGDSSNDLC
jgi:hypothetical protein